MTPWQGAWAPQGRPRVRVQALLTPTVRGFAREASLVKRHTGPVCELYIHGLLFINRGVSKVQVALSEQVLKITSAKKG